MPSLAPRHFYFTSPFHGKKLHYTEWGAHENPHLIVCVHGLTRNCRDFDYLAQALSSQYRVVCLDIVGRGESEWLDHATHYHYGTYLADITAWLLSIGATSFTWIGTSMGGILAMMYISQHPLQVKRLILNDIGMFVPSQALQRINHYLRPYPTFSSFTEAQIYLKATYKNFGIPNQTVWNHFTQNSIYEIKEHTYRLAYDYKLLQPLFTLEAASELIDIDLQAFWHIIRCPTLILRGALSDILPAETAEVMQHYRHNVQLITYPDIGHAPSLMDEIQIHDIISWLSKEI